MFFHAKKWTIGWGLVVLGGCAGVARAGTVFVDANAGSGGNGSSGAPFRDVQSGINAALNNDTVLVLPGTYPNFRADLHGKAITVKSQAGAAATTFDLTYVSTNNLLQCVSGEGPNTILDGFTIINGPGFLGSALTCRSASPTVRNCIFRQNSGVEGTISLYDCNSLIENCSFIDNQAYGGGAAGIFNTSAPLFKNCLFQHNTALFSMGGGALWSVSTSKPMAVNCLFVDNHIDYDFTMGGGAVYANNNSIMTLINCTFYNNSSITPGAAILTTDSGIVNLVNSILWNNPGDDIVSLDTSSVSATYSDIEGGFAGSNNSNIDPQFRNAAGYDFRLSAGSTCINTGSNAALPPGVTTDLAGQPRIQDSIVDRGAFEFLSCAGDLNGDGITNLSDLSQLLSHFGQTGNETHADGDLDGDHDVDLGDLANLLALYGTTCT